MKKMEYSETIYKIDSKGKLRFLHVFVEGDKLVQESGQVGGSAVRHSSSCTPKNVGKANETTAEEQAIAEASSKIANKMSTGYFQTMAEASDNPVILPMLAKDYKKEKRKVVFPCYVQPKLDGMRALYNKEVGFISRKGKKIDTMTHIEEALPTVSMLLNRNYIDGELYAHGKTFQENMRLIKKDRGEETKNVKYHVYDIAIDRPFIYRHNLLKNLCEDLGAHSLVLVPTYAVADEEELKRFHTDFLARGYEGTIIRHSDAGYGINKRDSQLLKYKDFIDKTYDVIDVVPSEKVPEQGVVICADLKAEYEKAGLNTFGCGMRFSHKEREEILANKEDYIGKKAEIRFFEYSEDGIPRFPVCHGFRLDK
jgi:DNA ligase-1